MEDGVASVCFSTGMAAIGAILVALTRAGDHIVASQHLFGNTVSMLGTLTSHGADITYVDATDAAAVERALDRRRGSSSSRRSPIHARRSQTSRIGALCAARGILYVVDNTMTSPALFRPKASAPDSSSMR
jgi:O-acetylhomoserine (thiol)-lyase